MKTHADKTQGQHQSQSTAHAVSKIQRNDESAVQLIDNRPEAATQRRLETVANGSPQVKQLMAVQQMANNRPQAGQATEVVQRRKGIPAKKHVQVNQGQGTWYGQVTQSDDVDGKYRIRLGGGGEENIHTVPERYVENHPMFGGPKNWNGERRLEDLLINTGGLGDLGIETEGEGNWEPIAKALKKDFLPYQRGLTELEDRRRYVANLCTLYVSREGGWKTKLEDDSQYTDQVPAVAAFIEKFMRNNGQLAYIEKQPWFQSGEWKIGIDVNYYPDRSEFKDALRFHKDTGGNNIFVNLIFDNETPIESTEWLVDVNEPSKRRKEWQSNLLPQEHLDVLDRNRKTLRYVGDETSEVSGGVSEKKNTYVSWVDDLIWHSTPMSGKRQTLTHEQVKGLYLELSALGQPMKSKKWPVWLEILGEIAAHPDTKLAKWLKNDGLGATDIDDDAGAQILGRYKPEKFSSDVEVLPEKIRVVGTYSESNAQDPRLPGSEGIFEPPVGLGKHRRSNSLKKNREKLEEAGKASAGHTRSFIRTWVRILRKDDPDVDPSVGSS